ncbi:MULTISPECIES: ABC transporter permease [Ornithinibacillus]|uniref:ABC transporter permease n=2 Tax=Ornithinibacillus TaxID=484508 RepID=A0A923RHC7_9BACI|nr:MULTISPECIES: ABC transporter permease [Ornithinibacillus]MBC5636471.1 ABC transporter permease [Ornithinibacillus hominis]MBS3680688.1 ABC transporter permease [Ornithinibacillus massiliensis]
MRFLNVLKANIKREYILLKRYLPNTIAILVTFYVIFLGMFFGITLIGDPSTQDANIQYVIVNYIFWFLAMLVVNDIGWQITNEATQGTLEQLGMSPMGIWKIMVSRLISITIVNFIMIIGLLYVSMLTSGQWLNIDVLSILPVFFLTLISMFGLGFMIAGLTMILKQIQAFLQILQFILAALTFVSISVAPFLAFFPFVKGIDMVRAIMINDMSITQFQMADILILVFNAVFYFGLGLFMFLRCEKFAMKKGLLAHY